MAKAKTTANGQKMLDDSWDEVDEEVVEAAENYRKSTKSHTSAKKKMDTAEERLIEMMEMHEVSVVPIDDKNVYKLEKGIKTSLKLVTRSAIEKARAKEQAALAAAE